MVCKVLLQSRCSLTSPHLKRPKKEEERGPEKPKPRSNLFVDCWMQGGLWIIKRGTDKYTGAGLSRLQPVTQVVEETSRKLPSWRSRKAVSCWSPVSLTEMWEWRCCCCDNEGDPGKAKGIRCHWSNPALYSKTSKQEQSGSERMEVAQVGDFWPARSRTAIEESWSN